MAFLLLLFGLAFAVPAVADVVELGPNTCIGGAGSAAEAFALTPPALKCDDPQYDRRDRFVRMHMPVPPTVPPPTVGLLWQTDPGAFSSMLVRFTFADGARRLVDVDTQMPARNWFAGNRFSVPVPSHPASLIAVDTVVERPHAESTLSTARLMPKRESTRSHYARSLAYGLICGLLVIPLIYNLLFYRVLRESFILWHAAMVAAMLAYILTSSGLIFLLFSQLPLAWRWHGNFLVLNLTFAFTAMFVLGMLERKVRSRWMVQALVGAAVLLVLTKLVALVAGDAARMSINTLYLLAFIPAGLAALAVLTVAIGKGSRSARWILAALSVAFLAGLVRVMQAAGLIQLPFPLDDLIFVAMAVQAIGTSLAVGDRFLILKQDRNQARSHAVRMGQMASTDPLTGLLNRRAFDAVKFLQEGQGLIVADIDRFKPINDAHGHQAGDMVLRRTAVEMQRALRPLARARIFRLGGEEFAVICSALQAAELVSICEMLRERVAALQFPGGSRGLPKITISLGATLGRGQPLYDAFAEADSALYSAKAMGRNRSVLYRYEPGANPPPGAAAMTGGEATPTG
ncbi:MAG: sensor domain-containing diguanylate cyclase [Qipengyuania sp.]